MKNATRTAAFMMLTAMTALVVGCGTRRSVEIPAGGNAIEDLQAAEGEWKVVSFESPNHVTIRPETIDMIKKLTFKVEGNLLRVRMPEAAQEVKALLRVDQSVSPKALDIVWADASGKPLMGRSKVGTGPETEHEVAPLMCIYSCDGTKLTIATTDFRAGLYRPTEFKAGIVKNDGGVVETLIAPDCCVVVLTLERLK